MPFDDPLQEFVTKEVALNNIIAPPEETEFRKQRTAEEAARPKFKTEKLPYITYDDVTTEGDLYDPLDFPTVSQKIRDNVLKAIVSRFPVSGERYTVKVENPHYETPRNTRKREERDAILRQESITDRLRGDLVLIDNATGNEVQRKTMTLVNVPRMTERGTFIRNGAFIGMKHMFRLRPGVYTRIKNNGIIQSHINPKQGTGRQMAIELDPESGVLALHRAGRQYGLLPLLEAAGMPEEEIRQSWGDELLHMNKEKYKQLFVAGSKKMEEYKRLWNDDIKPMLLDKETTQWTLGTPYESVQPRTLLQASNKMLRVARSAGDPDAPDETDDRDGLQYQTVLGPADYIAERILRDGGGLLRNTLNQITREGNLDKVQPGLFQPHVDSVFLDDGHTGYIDESSPLESIYFNSGVSRLGEGGIGDTRAAPAESRGVQNSYVGFVDVIQSPESLKVGLDNYLVQGVRKDDKGKLYTKMRFPDGRVKYVDMATTANSIYTTPEYFNPEADPNERIPAFVRGKSVEWVPRKDVNMYVADTSNMMSVSAGTVPMVGGIRSNRVLMGSKYGIQALPLAQREAPLVRRAYTDDDGNPTTAEKALGRSMGARFSPVDGTVVSVDPDEIVIKDAAGQKHTIDLYNNYVLNQKGFLQNTPEVQKGDQVKANQLVASSNYTDKDGNAALGVNLRMAFMTGKDATTYEDSILVAESVAKTKLASMQMYKTRGDATPDIEYNKDRFIRSFGRQEFTKEQLDKLGEDGIALEGAVLQKGDPIFLGVKTQEQSTKGIARNATVPYVETWEHDYPGTVRTIAHGRKHFMAYIDAATPMETGDKLCFDDKTEVFTDHGWRLFKDIQIDDRILTLDPKNGSTFLTDFRTLYEIRHKGRMYSLVTPDLDICVTENHNHLVTVNTNCMYMKFVQSDELFGLPYYHFIGMDHDFGKPRFYKCTQCKGSKERWVQYDGYVYCLEIPETHTLYVRRNGKCVWSGNSNKYGAKGVCRVVPDDQMPVDEQGNMIEVLQSPLGLPSRVNTAQVVEAQEGKIARLTGQPVELPDFTNENLIDRTLNRLAEHGLKESETLYDPATGKHIPDVETGVMFYYKLKHMSDSKQGARGLGSYTAEEVPTKGGKEGSRRFGGLEIGALLGGGGDELVRDAKLVRGQQNDEFWRSYMSGEIPDAPRTPLVHRKFFNHLRAAGVSITPNQGKLHIYGASAADVDKLTAGRQVTNSSTFDAKQMRPIKGGLFDPSIFGPDGDQWAYYELPEPVLNPLMFKPVAHMLGWKDKELEGLLRGERYVNNKVGIEALQDILSKVDLPRELRAAKAILKDPNAPLAKHDAALKKVRAIEPMIRENKKPADMLWTKLPILPPAYRQVSSLADDVNIVADANFLYKRVMDAADDLKEAKQVLPKEALMDARTSMYNAVDELVGLSEPGDPKLQAKNVGGLLKWAFGKGSPKLSSLHRKVFGATVDLGGRGTVVPDNSLSIDEIGVPEKTAWKLYEPQVVRRLRQRGFSMLDAIRNVTDRTPEARRILDGVMKDMPVLMNRAPTLWEYGIRGFYPKIVEGNATHVNPNIVSPFGMDFDGDCVVNLVGIEVELKKIIENFEKPKREGLTSEENGLYCILGKQTNKERDEKMFTKETSVFTMHQVMAIDDIPVVEGSEVQKSDTVTEWDVQEGYFACTLNPVDGSQCLAPITKKSLHRNCNMYHVTCAVAGGFRRIIDASEDHSLITYNSRTGMFEKTKPVNSVGRLVPRITPNNGNLHDKYLRYLDMGIQVPLGYKLGLFLGALLGDGWIDTNNFVHFAANDAQIRNFLAELTSSGEAFPVMRKSEDHIYSNEGSFGSSEKHRLTVYMNHKHSKALKKLIGTGAENKRIPWPCFGGNRAHLIGLLVGLLSTDGSVSYVHTAGKKSAQKNIAYHTISPYLRDGIQELAMRLGVRTTVRAYRGANSTSDCYMITFSVGDIVRLHNTDPGRFKLFHGPSQEALEKIVADVNNATCPDVFDIVPYPHALFSEFAYAGASDAFSQASFLSNYKKKGYMSREHALRIVKILEQADWDSYKEPSVVPKAERTNHSVKYAKALVKAWCELVKADRIKWTYVESAEPYGVGDAWDLTVPGPFTFALADGTVVQDTAALHVPVTKQAIQKVKEKMLPSRSLLSPQFNQVHYYPEAEFLQGLNLATREGKGKSVHFRTEEEMMAALKRGEITYDTPISIG